MAKQRTFIIVKPDGVRKNITGEVLRRIEKANMLILAAKLIQIRKSQAARLYKEHCRKKFYPQLIKFAMSGPAFAAVLSGKSAVKKMRLLAGATDPKKAKKGTIRGDFGARLPYNIVHASDSLKSAKRETKIFFKNREIIKR